MPDVDTGKDNVDMVVQLLGINRSDEPIGSDGWLAATIIIALAAERDSLLAKVKDRDDEIDDLDEEGAGADNAHVAAVATARNAALEEAVAACSYAIKNYDVMKPGGKVYEPLRVQSAAKGMVQLVREDIRALKSTTGD